MRTFLIAATALATLTAATPAFAVGFLSAQAGAHVANPLGGGISDHEIVERTFFRHTPRGEVRASAEAAGFGATGVGEASTDFGINRAFGRATSSATADVDERSPPFSVGGGFSQWYDELTIGTNGQGGFVSFDFQFHAFTAQSSYDSPEGVLEYSVQYVQLFPHNQIELYYLNMDGNGNTNSVAPGLFGTGIELTGDNPGDVLRLVSVTIPFISGQTFGIGSRLECGGRAPYTGTNSQVCNAGGTALWGGVTGVTDMDGNALTDWTVTSSSGTDYTLSLIPPAAAVPEPATWAMLIAGFGAAGAFIRRRTRCSSPGGAVSEAD